MNTFAVRDRYQDPSDAACAEHRPAHVEFLRGLYEYGPPLATEPLGALLIVETIDEAAVAASLDADPSLLRAWWQSARSHTGTYSLAPA